MAGSLGWTGDGLPKFEKVVKELGDGTARKLYRAAINAEGALLRKDAVRILPRQTGLAKETISRALGNPVRARASSLVYTLTTRGGFISLKYFAPVEKSGGVFAYPHGEAKFVNSGFITGGPIGARKALPLNGHVYAPNGRSAGKKSQWQGAGGNQWGRGFAKQVSDVRIPDELVRDDMKRSYEKHKDALEPRIFAAIKKQYPGTF